MPSNDKLMKASQWAKREFEIGSIPNPKTIKKWVQNGVVNGKIIDQSVWIFSSEKMGVSSSISAHVKALIEDE